MGRIKPPDSDVYVGMGAYLSGCPGISGIIKACPEDFSVREVMPDGKALSFDEDMPGDLNPGEFTHFTMVKRGWETMRAVREIARRLGVSKNRLSFAGTKDKNALTAQRVCARGIPVERLRAVDIRDITLKDFGYDDESLGLGCLKANRFTIRVRGVCESPGPLIEEVWSTLESGFPNFFGMQRFGQVRPITQEVGYQIVRGDFEAAVMTYLAKAFPGEDESVKNARLNLMSTRDYRAAAKSFPARLGYELALINHLIQYEGDYSGALMRLPRNLLSMFVHAYQSLIYNKALSECIREGYYVERLPLAGYDIKADDISRKYLDADGVSLDDFRVRGLRDASSKGSYRDCFVPALDYKYSIDGGDCIFKFTLEKGCYATVFLREFMKNQGYAT
jgi:tRNA pseudouridine13 synthase